MIQVSHVSTSSTLRLHELLSRRLRDGWTIAAYAVSCPYRGEEQHHVIFQKDDK